MRRSYRTIWHNRMVTLPMRLGLMAAALIVVLVGPRAASAQTPVRILPLGDSITLGVNDNNPPGGFPGYRASLWNQLIAGGFNVDFVGSLADGPATIDRNHEGHGGFRIDQIIAGIDGYLSATNPDVILLHIGTNDLLQDLTVDLATQRLAELLDRIHQARPTAHVIVASIIPIRNPNVFNADTQQFAEFVSHTARLVGDRAALGWKISHLDMAHLVVLTQSQWDSIGIHPNDAGYAKMANVWYPEVATLLDGDAPPTVGVTSPFDLGTVSGAVTLSAKAFDDFGVTGVEFAIDGTPVFDDLFAPYKTSWDSATISNGPHTLRVTARDAAGQTRVQSVRFRVVNPLVDPALVASFGFDETDGVIAFDGSGRGNHADLIGVTRTSQGHSGKAAAFSGSRGRVEMKNPAADLRFTTSFTISAWVNATTLPSGWHIIAARQLGARTGDSWGLGHNGATLYFGAGATVSTTLTAGQWTHIAAVKDGSTVALYKNGVLVASTTSATSPLATDANEVGIGAGNNGNPLWGEFFNGRIDDLRFYAEARTLPQIRSDMNNAVGGINTSLRPLSSVGLYRQGSWFVDLTNNNQWDGCAIDACVGFGISTDIPVVGDWMGTGQGRIGVFRNGAWYLDRNGNGLWDGCGIDACHGFGAAADIPVVGDWTGSGQAKIGVFRSGAWYLDLNGNGLWDGCAVDACREFGSTTDIPVVGDWTGTGTTKLGVYRSGAWYLDLNGNAQWNGCGIDACHGFGGGPSDVPVVGDWTGTGRAKIGVYRDGAWYLDLNGTGFWDGCSTDTCIGFGAGTDVPVVGRW